MRGERFFFLPDLRVLLGNNSGSVLAPGRIYASGQTENHIPKIRIHNKSPIFKQFFYFRELVNLSPREGNGKERNKAQ